MASFNATPPSSEGAATTGPSLKIVVSRTSEQDSKPFLVDEPSYESWTICRLFATPFVWDRIKSVPGIYIAGRCGRGKVYEAVVHGSAIPWLRLHNCDLDLQYDPTKPLDGDVRVYGTGEAKKRAKARFLESAVKAIRSGQPRGVGSCYRMLAMSRCLDTALELAILEDDIQQLDDQIQRKFAQHLMFFRLNLLEDYDTPIAIQLLEESQDEICFGALRRYNNLPLSLTDNEIRQIIALIRCLLELVGGRKDFRQHRPFQFQGSVNARIYGIFVGVCGSNPFGKFDPQKVLNALARSELFSDEDIRTLDVVDWKRRVMAYLPVGKLDGYMHLPTPVLNGLGSVQVDILGVSITHFYQTHPSLRAPDNNILVLLAYCPTINNEVARVVRDWMASNDGSRLYQALIEEYQENQTMPQLALRLATLLSYKQLLPNTLNDTTQSIGRVYLTDFDALVHGDTVPNERSVVESMMFSFVRVLSIGGDDCQEIVQFLVTVLDTDPPSPTQEDGFLDRYWVRRAEGLDHEDAVMERLSLLPTEIASAIEEDSEIEEDWEIEEDFEIEEDWAIEDYKPF